MSPVQHGPSQVRPADLVTTVRLGLAVAVAVLVVAAPQEVAALVAVAAVALVLDGVDGPVARRTGTVSDFGARYDMEVDAFLVLVLSVHVAATTAWWALLIGLARYLLLFAGLVWPWLRRPTPPRYWAKVVAVVQGVVLVVVSAALLPHRVELVLLGAALVLLAESFGHQVWELAGRPSWRRVFVVVAVRGLVVLAGPVLVLRALDAGFGKFLDRPFDPLTDPGYLGPAVGVLRDGSGLLVAVLAVVGAVLLVAAVLLATPYLLLRAGRRLAGRGRVGRVLAVLVAGGLAYSLTGYSAAVVGRVHADLADRRAFAAEIAKDRYAGVPPGQLLQGLRGKDVLLVFVESYGRVALERPDLAASVVPVLEAGTRNLRQAGFGTRSAFLTSPTFGAASWLAHSTLQSGLWVDSEGRYEQLLRTDRLTLTSAFGAAGWRTVFDVPANTRDWPEGAAFYGFDRLYDARNVGYDGPKLGYVRVPDQYTLAQLHQRELAGHRTQPVMAEVDLISSHHPWQPLPPLVQWSELGDGSVYSRVELQDGAPVRTAYARSVRHSLQALVAFLERWPDRDLVLVVLGDHQPHGYVTGPHPGHDVPVTVIARDRAVLDRIAGWGWQPGLHPTPDAPVWRMDTFRDRFLAAFSR